MAEEMETAIAAKESLAEDHADAQHFISNDLVRSMLFFKVVEKNPSNLIRINADQKRKVTRTHLTITLRNLVEFNEEKRNVLVSATSANIVGPLDDITEQPLVLNLAALPHQGFKPDVEVAS